MSRWTNTNRSFWALGLAVLVLAACSSGSETTTTSNDAADASASESAAPAPSPTAAATVGTSAEPTAEPTAEPEPTAVAVEPSATPVPDVESESTTAVVESPGCLTGIDGAVVTCTATTIIIESDGLPSHPIMEGIANGGWNGQWPSEQDYTGSNAFMIPTEVVLAAEPALTVMNATGVTANGIPFFFPHAPGRAGGDTCLDLPAEILPEGECMRDPVAAGEMDICGGHTGRGGDYHYHAAPTCVFDDLPPGSIVGYMLDGIAMYVEPIEGSVPYDGCSGWISPDGLLHYAFQDSFPYLTSCMLGEFAEGPRTQGTPEFTGGLDTRTIGSIDSYTSEAGCQTMTFSNGAELTHCD